MNAADDVSFTSVSPPGDNRSTHRASRSGESRPRRTTLIESRSLPCIDRVHARPSPSPAPPSSHCVRTCRRRGAVTLDARPRGPVRRRRLRDRGVRPAVGAGLRHRRGRAPSGHPQHRGPVAADARRLHRRLAGVAEQRRRRPRRRGRRRGGAGEDGRRDRALLRRGRRSLHPGVGRRASRHARVHPGRAVPARRERGRAQRLRRRSRRPGRLGQHHRHEGRRPAPVAGRRRAPRASAASRDPGGRPHLRPRRNASHRISSRSTSPSTTTRRPRGSRCRRTTPSPCSTSAAARITAIRPLGFKDHNAAGKRARPERPRRRRQHRRIAIVNRPVFGMYQPDAIGAYEFKGRHVPGDGERGRRQGLARLRRGGPRVRARPRRHGVPRRAPR